jgi:hypothetical protein
MKWRVSLAGVWFWSAGFDILFQRESFINILKVRRDILYCTWWLHRITLSLWWNNTPFCRNGEEQTAAVPSDPVTLLTAVYDSLNSTLSRIFFFWANEKLLWWLLLSLLSEEPLKRKSTFALSFQNSVKSPRLRSLQSLERSAGLNVLSRQCW